MQRYYPYGLIKILNIYFIITFIYLSITSFKDEYKVFAIFFNFVEE